MHSKSAATHNTHRIPDTVLYRWERRLQCRTTTVQATRKDLLIESVQVNTPPFDIKEGHKWFAIALNNSVWDALESPSRSADQDMMMVHAAHASCYHWLQSGGPEHHARAECLVANVYAVLGNSSAALEHGNRCLQLDTLDQSVQRREASDTQRSSRDLQSNSTGEKTLLLRNDPTRSKHTPEN